MPQGLPKGIPGKSKAYFGMAGHAWTHPTEICSLTCYLSLLDISIQKIKEINALLLEILMIKESCNLIGQEHFGL